MAHRIRKINVSTRDTVRVVAGAALASSANITSIDVAANGIIYAADYYNHVVYKIFENGRIDGVLLGDIGTAGDVPASGIGASTGLTGRANAPLGLCVDKAENIYVGNVTGRIIRRLSSSGRWQALAGSATATGNVVAGLDDLTTDGLDVRFGAAVNGMGMTIDLHGIVYLADTANHRIKKIWDSGLSTSLAGSTAGFVNATGMSARFNAPYDVAVDAHGTVYVADYNNNRIRKVTESGVVTTLAGATANGFTDGNGLDARFDSPARLALAPSGRELYVLDVENGAIRRVDQHGNVNTFAPYNASVTNGDIAIDNSGFIYVLENDS